MNSAILSILNIRFIPAKNPADCVFDHQESQGVKAINQLISDRVLTNGIADSEGI